MKRYVGRFVMEKKREKWFKIVPEIFKGANPATLNATQSPTTHLLVSNTLQYNLATSTFTITVLTPKLYTF